jgi:predicted solute-binding protein
VAVTAGAVAVTVLVHEETIAVLRYPVDTVTVVGCFWLVHE